VSTEGEVQKCYFSGAEIACENCPRLLTGYSIVRPGQENRIRWLLSDTTDGPTRDQTDIDAPRLLSTWHGRLRYRAPARS
jgi:hypothetical protein